MLRWLRLLLSKPVSSIFLYIIQVMSPNLGAALCGALDLVGDSIFVNSIARLSSTACRLVSSDRLLSINLSLAHNIASGHRFP